MHIAAHGQFVYHQTMNAEDADLSLSSIAAAIAEPARTRMLCCLLDGHARTSTELAVVGEVSPSTASVHLARLREQRLVEVVASGKHRYYRLAGRPVAAALEALLAVAGESHPFVPTTPDRLRDARTCYDHLAGTLGVRLHDRCLERGWLMVGEEDASVYTLTEIGEQKLLELGLDTEGMRKLRRRFACACLDWSERRPHLGGALGAGLLQLMREQGWVEQDLDSRALHVTPKGRRHLSTRWGIAV
jgi:DNA-binding transcriptional ArsR family regulator